MTQDTISEGLRHQRQLSAARGPFVTAGRMLAAVSNGRDAIMRRRRIPIHFYVGPNGGGKTLAMIRDTLPSLDAGRLVYSTVPLLDSKTGKPHPNYRPFRSWHQFLEAESADFLMDEIAGVASSRDHSGLHSEVINRMNQLRKADLFLRLTAPAWARADKVVREVTQGVTECRGYLQDMRAVKGRESEQFWAPRRLFRFRTFNMIEFDEWSSGKRERMGAEVKEWFYGVDSREFASYRTLDAVERLEAYDPNVCGHCGKPMRREVCKGHDGPAPAGLGLGRSRPAIVAG